jgi:hypothetical protein
MRPGRILRLVLAITLVASSGHLGAQQPTAPAKTGKGRIAGVVVDSLNGRYLEGADVIIDGAEGNLVTDSAGRFEFDNIAPGTYQVGVFHPLLDTLGISLSTKPFRVGPDSLSTVVFAVPSAETIIHSTCHPQPNDLGNSAVIGHVNDPDTFEPVAGAEISVAWTELKVSTELGIRHTPHLLRDTSNAAGAFHICGLPSSMHATLQARKGIAVTADIPVTLGDVDPELVARTVLLPRSGASAAGNATVSGKVVLEGNTAGAGTRVELVGTDLVTMTDAQGQFTLSKLPSGTRVLLARHLGYTATTVTVDLTSREPKAVTITLPKFIAMMDPVLVTARLSASLDKVGFAERRKSSGNGYFLGPDQLREMRPAYLTDILRRLPSIRVTGTAKGDRVVSSRGVNSPLARSCIQYFLDEMPWQSASPGDINNFVTGREIVAVELYQPGQAPPQYSMAGSNCVTILLWTRFRLGEVSEK